MPGSAASWAAILAGAAGAAALTLILLVLGAGLGFSAVSPWAQRGADASTIGVGAIVYVTLTALLASAMGGYLAGRLRTRWVGTHDDEIYFRDTAHGFLAWAIATLVTAMLSASTVGGILGKTAEIGGNVVGGAATAAVGAGAAGAASAVGSSDASRGNDGAMGYMLDSLFRRANGDGAAPAAPDANAPAPTAEMGRIMAHALREGSLSPEDLRYAGQLVAQRTGLSQADAEKRVNDAYTRAQTAAKEAADKARDAADKARKAASYASLWLFVSLLIGAFSASLAATYGGRRRDLY